MRHFVPALLVLLLALLFSLAVGSTWIPLEKIFAALQGNGTNLTENILWNIRLPRTALIALTGMALGGSGAAYQGLFRNPLADPFLIGIASGAGLGAVVSMTVKWPYSFWGLMAIPLSAFIGALLTVSLVYFLARVGQTTPVTNLILAGVAVSSFATSLMSFIMLRSDGELRRAMSWLMGGSIQPGWTSTLAMLPYLIVGLGALLLHGHALNLMQFGDEQAQQLGLNVQRAKRIILIASSLATAAAVSFAGIIGFVGLVVPHVIRLWFGGDYRRLIPLSILGGATALLVSDVIARVALAPQELPVGIITALAGAPFFLWVLRRAKTQGLW
ncbi:MAG: iron ABC transporter permease [Chloroflexi bacterium CFX1]|nr:iron ABC transporter permease [Chloroflexi bacterium CFX1]MCQ3952006.1 iron ABC transporter permease [Chloroflexota bacterium]MDL1918132.1 iron ABC transporter permease [Chloroflexi bacterium CFX5]NUQ59979.1 iron ABC transporter permease [Anaerolineales bacterium]